MEDVWKSKEFTLPEMPPKWSYKTTTAGEKNKQMKYIGQYYACDEFSSLKKSDYIYRKNSGKSFGLDVEEYYIRVKTLDDSGEISIVQYFFDEELGINKIIESDLSGKLGQEIRTYEKRSPIATEVPTEPEREIQDSVITVS